MTESLEFETYLSISAKKFGIYLLDTKNLKNLYFEEKNFENNISILDLNILEKFLDNNIFKIEKLIGKFVKNPIYENTRSYHTMAIRDNSELVNDITDFVINFFEKKSY